MDSGRITPRSTSQNFCCQCPCSQGEPQPTTASAGDPPTLAGRSGSICGVTAPSPWVPMRTLLYVCPPRVESLFPPVLSKSYSQIPLSLQSLILWEFLLLLPNPQVGKPDMGLRTFTPVGGLPWYNCSPVCESPTQRFWDLILL